MSLIGVIASLQTPGPYTVTRTASGSYDTHGRYTAGSESTFTIVASIQPVTGRDIDDLAEGQSSSEARVVYTTTELRNRQPGNEADEITLDGEDYVIDKVERWQAFGQTHYRALAIRITVP